MTLFLAVWLAIVVGGAEVRASERLRPNSQVSEPDGSETDIPVGVLSWPSGRPLPYGYAPGYTDDVDDEVSSEPQEMVLMEKPAFLNGPDLHEKIFNKELTNEFLFKYQQTFGYTEQEENYFLTSQQGYYLSPAGLLATQQDDQRRQFAEYVMRRLTEYHTENIMKNDPALKKVYEVKQAVSNVKIEAGPHFKVDMMYSFVGNYLKSTITNPVALTYVTINMDPGSLTPTTPNEIFVLAQKPLTRTITGEAGYNFYGRGMHFMVAKALAPGISTNLTENFYLSGLGIDGTREGLTLLGFSVTF